MNLEPSLPGQHFGKYRGIVRNNLDPERLGRIQALVPSVSPNILGWAFPCTPYPAAGSAALAVPPIGTFVWIEFENGDVSNPVWTGCFWNADQPPLLQLPD